jgi:hypothetical protein
MMKYGLRIENPGIELTRSFSFSFSFVSLRAFDNRQ